ncbi:hypothetical protein ACP70R_033166 [Stipagrostis hirtigluma subsp. patula]
MKPWNQAIPKGLILLVVILGPILPGSIARKDQVSDLVVDLVTDCGRQRSLLDKPENIKCVIDIRKAVSQEGRGSFHSQCCAILGLATPDCFCPALTKYPEGRKALGKVCNLPLEKQCAATEAEKKAAQAREKAAKDREVALSKLAPCDRFFARLGAKEIDKINPDDAKACRQEMKTCPASCLRKQ